jgi:hypothetical protein
MFFPVEAPPEATSRALGGLRRSLNSPVVTIESLPVGPASAAIALHAGAPERPRVTIAIRSLQSRQVAFYGADEESTAFPTPAVAVDAALSFAESMGFLFDDDDVEALGDEGPRRAARLWAQFVSPGAEEVEELLLEDLADPTPEAASEAPELLLEAQAPAGPRSPAGMPLDLPELIEPEPLPEIRALAETSRERGAHAPAAREPDAVSAAPEPPPAVLGPAEPAADEADPGADLAEVPRIPLTKFRRLAASLAQEAAPDARIRLLSRF